MAELLSQAASPVLPRCVAWAYICEHRASSWLPTCTPRTCPTCLVLGSTALPSYTLQNVPVHVSDVSRLR